MLNACTLRLIYCLFRFILSVLTKQVAYLEILVDCVFMLLDFNSNFLHSHFYVIKHALMKCLSGPGAHSFCGFTAAQHHAHSFYPVGCRSESEGQQQKTSWVETKTAQQVKQKLCTQAKHTGGFIHHFSLVCTCSTTSRKEGLFHK